jgi:hypothetical protein
LCCKEKMPYFIEGIVPELHNLMELSPDAALKV